MMAVKTTDARTACWNAIEAYPSLNPGGVSVFKRKFKHETGEGGTLQTIIAAGIGDLPSIEIKPGSQQFDWQTQRMAEFPYNVEITLIHTCLWKIEQYAQDIVKALWQQSATLNGMPYVRAATGYSPQQVSISAPTLAKISDRNQSTKAWKMVLNFLLKFQYDPFGSP